MMERTLILIKPDGVQRALTGKILAKFEEAGLKIIAAKAIKPTKKLAEDHYQWDEKWAKSLWEKTKKGYDEKGQPFKETWEQFGKMIRGTLLDYIVNKPVLAFVLEGNDAISCCRKILGATAPSRADPGSIRGMFSTDSYDIANRDGRSVYNIVHASEDKANADREIPLWFKKDEMISYKRCDEGTMFG